MFGHITQRVNNADAKILTASSPEDLKKLPGCPWITWMMALVDDVKSHSVTLTEAVNVVQSQPVRRLLVMSGTTHCCDAN